MEAEASWRPIWIRGGKIEHLTWVGRDVLAWCLGMHIVFYNVPERRESLRWCSKTENGDGVSCLSGHPIINVLAFTSKSFKNPKIFVLSYPSMKTISECVRGSPSEYLATAFTTSEHLISLGSYPSYSLSLWCWRNGERLASVETPIHDIEGQIIQVSASKRFLIAQLGRRSGKMHVWESSPAGKTILLRGHEITLPGSASPYQMDWSSESHDPQLVIVDNFANIYIANHDGSEAFRAVLTQRCGVCLNYEAPSVRWFHDGIVLRTTFCQIRFYKKDARDIWRKEWYIKSILKPSVLSVHRSKHETLFYHTYEGYLMELKVNEGLGNPVIERRLHCGGNYRFVESVNPWGHHLLAIDDTVELSVLDCYDGRQVAKLDLGMEGEIMQLLSHLDHPMAAVSSEGGELALLSLHLAENPFLITKVRLQSERLDLLKFSQCGKYLVTGQRTTGVCYCLSLQRNKPIAVIARLETKCRMTDVLLWETRGHLKLFVLVVSSRKVTVGHHMIVYEIHEDRQTSTEPACYLELPNAYQFLHYSPQGANFMIGTPYLSRQIHLLEIKDWQQVNLLDVMSSEHELRRARLCTDRAWITSAAFDGQVTLRNGITRRIVVTLHPHHRRDLGAVKAIVKASGDLVVSLGHDGSLVGMRSWQMEDGSSPDDTLGYYRVDFGEYERRRNDIMADYSSLDSSIVRMLSEPIELYPSLENDLKKTWLDWSQEARIRREAEECSQVRTAIQVDFTKLQSKVVQLLDINDASPEIERLPIADFDLDKMTRDSRLKAARDARDNTRLELEASRVSMDRVARWIKTTFWDPQKIVGRSIFTIFDNIGVTNYPTKNDDPLAKEMLELGRFFKDSIRTVMDSETFSPWKLYAPSQLEFALRPKVHFRRLNERQPAIDIFLSPEDEEDRETSPDEIEDRLAKEGMTTHRFIDESEHYYSQFECYGFAQLLLNNRSLVNDCKMLREFFNKYFDDIFSSKEREMSVIREKHERIRYIDSELRIMFGQSVSILPIDPDWKFEEQPSGIVRVLDTEVKVRPYVSPSQQELLDKQAWETERLRQLSLADDFREKALIKMMDGVLEVRWEDVIKRDVQKPRCMLEKEPGQYNTEDLLAIRQYDKDVEDLENERFRYHRMLESELAKIGSVLQETIERFNARIHDLVLMKMRVEAAIQQLNLRNVRDYMRHVYRMQSFVAEDGTREEIVDKMKILGHSSDDLQTLQGLLQEYRNQYEALLAREKTTEKKFKSDFPTLGKSSVELLLKEYKRRPRTSLKNVTAGELVELGRNAASRIKVTYLSHDSTEYLRNLDSLDIRPVGLPGVIDNHHWEHLVRMRRNRIELEMKTRSQMAELNETERRIAEHEEKIDRIKAHMDSLKERVTAMRQERTDYDLDMEIQLVLKMGQVEARPAGRRDDVKNSFLIPRGEIENVNAMIVQAGAGKIKTMNHSINFHRGIICKEWEHKCLKMKIEDLEREFHTVQNLLVTRDTREFLYKHHGGYDDDKTPAQLEKEHEAMKQNCLRNLSEWVDRLENVGAKIENTRRKNHRMDRKITEMNVERWELEWQRDVPGETRRKIFHDRAVSIVSRRAKLVRQLHEEYTEVLALQTEHELLRLRKFPILNFFKTLNDEPAVR